MDVCRGQCNFTPCSGIRGKGKVLSWGVRILNAIAHYEMETESKIKVELSAVQHGTDLVSMAYTHNTANNG